jgi:hypothetical protein
MPADVTPLDPDSPRGRAAQERITQVFAEVALAIAQRKADRGRQDRPERAA